MLHPRKGPHKTAVLLAAVLLLGACKANINVTEPNDTEPTPSATVTAEPTASPTASSSPSASPTASPSASPTASPSPAPSPSPTASASATWSTVIIQASLTTWTAFIAEVRRLEALNQCRDVVFLDSYRVQLSASAQVTAQLKELASTEYINFTSLFQGTINLQTRLMKALFSAQEFIDFWKAFAPNSLPLPSVNFSQQTVIVIMPGFQTGATSTTVLSIKKSDRQLKVRYKVNTSQSSTSANPVQYLVIPLSKLRGDFDQISFELAS
ncbi:MAG: hypothetical protein ACAI44_09420 [Candidatus Sericytochromatia bacterium]